MTDFVRLGVPKYRKYPFIEKMTNFRIKWQKCEDLQHLGCWNLVCSIILGCYKKFMQGFWKCLFCGHFSGVKVRFWPFLTKNRVSILPEWPKNFQNPHINFCNTTKWCYIPNFSIPGVVDLAFLSFYAKIGHFFYKGRFPIFLAHLASWKHRYHEDRRELRSHSAHFGN